MRCTRLLRVSVLFGLLSAPSMATAQEQSPFTNSWFWGAKGGLLVMHTEIGQTNAPMIGAEWLITRSKWGLYIGLDQSYFDAVSTVADAPTTGITRRVDIRDMRRATAAMYFFPREFITIRPYAGIGVSLNYIVRAASQSNTFSTPTARDTVLARIEDAKTRASILTTLGLQWKMGKLAPFVQGTVMPTKGNTGFFLNGETFSYFIEAGLRYNFGSAIEVFR
ncbi:MAG TPA: hypothetical protein VJR92_12350 [Gemmatimonadaceae bacterium]|nr:hypothetical protein [Gemmatimonadaceae bacterium]